MFGLVIGPGFISTSPQHRINIYSHRCTENKDADQLRGYREADLSLCFRICKKPVFSRRGSNNVTSESDVLLSHSYMLINSHLMPTAHLVQQRS